MEIISKSERGSVKRLDAVSMDMMISSLRHWTRVGGVEKETTGEMIVERIEEEEEKDVKASSPKEESSEMRSLHDSSEYDIPLYRELIMQSPDWMWIVFR